MVRRPGQYATHSRRRDTDFICDIALAEALGVQIGDLSFVNDCASATADATFTSRL